MKPSLLPPLLVLLLAAACALAEVEVRPAARFLQPLEVRGAGARACALGGAFAAVGGVAEALFFNPAGLADLSGFEVAAHHYEGFASLREERIAGAFETGLLGAVGFEAHSVGYGRVDSRDEQGYPFDGATTGRQGAAAGWGVPILGGPAAGAAMHVTRQQLMGREKRALWFDAGVQGRIGPGFRAGAACRGIGSVEGGDTIPLLLSLGGAYRAGGAFPILLLLSVDYQPEGAHYLGVGAEQQVSGNFKVRLGSRVPLTREEIEGFRAFAAGFGYRQGSLLVDYAVEPRGDLGFTHRVSLGASVLSKAPAEPTPVVPVPAAFTPTPTVTATPVENDRDAWTPTPTPRAAGAGSTTPIPSAPQSAGEAAELQDQLRVYSMEVGKGMDSTARARVQELIEAVKKPGSGPEAWWELGQFYELSGYPEYARKCYENVLKLDPKHPGARQKMPK